MECRRPRDSSMSNSFFELITCPSGDWEVVKVYGCVLYEGHKITKDQWLSLIKLATVSKDIFEIKETEISDKEMEEGAYYGTN